MSRACLEQACLDCIGYNGVDAVRRILRIDALLGRPHTDPEWTTPSPQALAAAEMLTGPEYERWRQLAHDPDAVRASLRADRDDDRALLIDLLILWELEPEIGDELVAIVGSSAGVRVRLLALRMLARTKSLVARGDLGLAGLRMFDAADNLFHRLLAIQMVAVEVVYDHAFPGFKRMVELDFNPTHCPPGAIYKCVSKQEIAHLRAVVDILARDFHPKIRN